MIWGYQLFLNNQEFMEGNQREKEVWCQSIESFKIQVLSGITARHDVYPKQITPFGANFNQNADWLVVWNSGDLR